MIILFLASVAGISVFEILRLKKKGYTKDIVVLIVCMVLVAALGTVYLSNSFRPSIASYLLNFLNIEG